MCVYVRMCVRVCMSVCGICMCMCVRNVIMEKKREREKLVKLGCKISSENFNMRLIKFLFENLLCKHPGLLLQRQRLNKDF